MARGLASREAKKLVNPKNHREPSQPVTAFLWFGLGQGIVVVLVALLLRAPQPGERRGLAAGLTAAGFSLLRVLHWSCSKAGGLGL
jgi:hypothetical protein